MHELKKIEPDKETYNWLQRIVLNLLLM